jgi:hypothetical protein
MNFILIRSIDGDNYNASNRVMIGKINNQYRHSSKDVISVGVIIKTNNDFDLDKEFIVAGETDSVQYRPKVLYIDKTGKYFFKKKNRYSTDKVYIGDSATKELADYIKNAKQYLIDNYGFTELQTDENIKI